MKISKDSFFSVGKNLKISQEQIESFWKELESANESTTPTSFAKYLYYLGGLIVIFTMTWFFDLGKELFGGGGIFLIAATYALICILLGRHLWNKGNLKTPAGLLFTIAVCMVPLAIYGLQTYFNLWPSDNPESYKDFYNTIDGNWVFMELGTIIAGLIMLWYFPFPFLTAPIFIAAWFLTMDVVSLIFGRDTLSWEQRSAIALGFGIILLIISFLIDRNKNGDYAFWGYLFGTLSFWSGLGGLVWDKSEGILFFYLLVNLAMMTLSIILRRSVLMIFGAIGVFAYLSHLAYKVFADSLAFPLALSVIGLGIIYLGILYQRNAEKIQTVVFKRLPDSFKSFLDKG